MKKYYPVLFILVFISCSDKEISDTEPVPEIGWCEFKKSIIYPESYKRAVINGYADAIINVDRLGQIKDIDVKANLPGFESAIITAVKITKWLPAKSNGKNIDSSVHLSIHFVHKRYERMMIIDAED